MQSTPLAAALATTLLLGACGTTAPRVAAPTSPAEVGELRAGSGYLKGYLPAADLPDSLALLPAPPAAGSAALAADGATFRTLTALQGTPRGALAVQDANLKFPKAAEVFSCALGMPISEEATPNLNMLLRRTLADAGSATYKAKNKYERTRPFVVFKARSCTPGEEAELAKDGSYPSGHSAVGWAWALVLSEIAPDRGNALNGRLIGAATVAKLHANPVFQTQMAAAQAEIAKARATGAVPTRDCGAEAKALATSELIAP